MATWKKVAVSGSDISQFNNDAGYITSITAQNAFATASYDGTLLLADDANGNLTFASSSDQGLTISANAGTDTLTFGLSAIPNTSLANSTISRKALGANLDDLTIGNGLVASSAYNGSAARTVEVGAGTHITVNTNDVAVDTTTLIASISGSILSTITGDVVVDADGNATIQANSVALGTDTTGDYVANLGIGTGVTIGSNTGEGSQPTIAVDYGSGANNAVEGDTTITLTQTSGEIDITGTAAQALGGGPSYTIGLADTISGNRTFSGNTITINNDLIVQGTASFQNTTNLEVSDRFVLFASGSTETGDGGIVVQQATQDVGELFGYDSGTTRWGVTSSFTANNSAYTPDAFMSAVTTLASTNPNTSGPAARYDAVGNIYVSSGDESIWIYS
jgi:hypothetical protein